MYNEVTFEIKKHIATITTHETGWTKELNIVSWNGNPEKYDIRDWSADHSQMSRGITLTKNDAVTIAQAILNDTGSDAND